MYTIKVGSKLIDASGKVVYVNDLYVRTDQITGELIVRVSVDNNPVMEVKELIRYLKSTNQWEGA